MPFSTRLPFGTLWSSPKIQGFLWKLAWHRSLSQDFFQRLHHNIALSPLSCVLCFANSEYNDHLFIRGPFSWLLWGKLFKLINLCWVIPFDIPSLISLWRAFPLPPKPRKLWNLCLHALLWSIWKERTKRLFVDIFGDIYSVWDYFCT